MTPVNYRASVQHSRHRADVFNYTNQLNSVCQALFYFDGYFYSQVVLKRGAFVARLYAVSLTLFCSFSFKNFSQMYVCFFL